MNDTTDSLPISSPKKKPAARKKKTVYKYPLVVVTWDDAESDPLWQSEPVEALPPCFVTSVGFLIRDDPKEDRILIADSYIDDKVHTIGNTNKIPRGMIKNIQILVPRGFKKS